MQQAPNPGQILFMYGSVETVLFAQKLESFACPPIHPGFEVLRYDFPDNPLVVAG